MHIISIGDLFIGCVLSLWSVYCLLGLFSNAPWLHTDGQRKDGQWVVTAASRYWQVARFIFWTTIVVTRFDTAFHRDSDGRDLIIFGAMALCLVFLYWRSRLEEKRNRKAA